MVIVGRTKIPYNDLFILKKNELDAIVEGHEIDIREEWERERIAAYLNISPHLKKNSNLTPQKLWELPWDQIKIPKQIDKIDFRENVAKFKERIAQHKAKLAKKNGQLTD